MELEAHLDRVDARSPADGDRLAEALSRRSWPSGTEGPGGSARAWLSRWTPRIAGVLPPSCSCASGRCGICG